MKSCAGIAMLDLCHWLDRGRHDILGPDDQPRCAVLHARRRLVLLLGTRLSQRVAPLARYRIPSPIAGGVLFATAATVLLRITGQGIAMMHAAKSDLRMLLHGGSRLVWFVSALVPFLLVQDALGVLMARLLGPHPFLGLVAAGSITLVGGHGTGAAYIEIFGEADAIPGVMALTMRRRWASCSASSSADLSRNASSAASTCRPCRSAPRTAMSSWVRRMHR